MLKRAAISRMIARVIKKEKEERKKKRKEKPADLCNIIQCTTRKMSHIPHGSTSTTHQHTIRTQTHTRTHSLTGWE